LNKVPFYSASLGSYTKTRFDRVATEKFLCPHLCAWQSGLEWRLALLRGL